MSQDSLEEENVIGKIHPGVEREDRAKRKRELFDSIENDSKRLPPSKRKRSHILPISPTDSDDRDVIKIQESSNYTKGQPVTQVTIESSSTKKSEETVQPRRSSRKKNTVKLNKVFIMHSGATSVSKVKFSAD